jgi:triosephosphate isomerase
MRKLIIAGNWKMNKTMGPALDLTVGLRRELADESRADVVLCPPYIVLSEIAELVRESNIKLGAQDMYWEDEGAYTGEISAPMLKDIGCEYVIIGHSERRKYFNETNDTVNKKLKAALSHGITPIMCVGEQLEEREAGKTFEVVKDHVVNGLSGISKDDAVKVIIAYEPVWAIGTGKTATPDQAQEVHGFIRKELSALYDKEAAEKMRIQYGGSVKPDNAAELMGKPDVDGALVGGASLKAESFVSIIKNSLGG